MLIAMLDGLPQRYRLWDHPRRAPAFACQHPLAIGPRENGCIALPPIAEPRERAMVSSLDRSGHGLLNELLVQGASGAGHHEATVPTLH